MRIPGFVLRKLYVPGSLRATPEGVRFVLRNSLASARLTGLKALRVDNRNVPPERVRVRVRGREVRREDVGPEQPLEFPRGEDLEVLVEGPVQPGMVKVRLEALSPEFGELVLEFEDDLAA